MNAESKFVLELQAGHRKYKVSQAYVAGYESGLKWPAMWEGHGEPGGPYVPSQPLTSVGPGGCRE